jgi:NADPH:quinone reductase-like Zn-dependent oxidoreductase
LESQAPDNLSSLSLDTVPAPTPSPTDLTISIVACALNHRDLFIRQHLYPGTTFSVPLLADGVGIVQKAPSTAENLVGKRVILTPGRGWKDSPDGPESPKGYAILGGTKTYPVGTAQEIVCIDESEVELAPDHLSDAEAAALPLTGLTAWRALVTKSGNFEAGRNILVTGIGGGVALMVLLFAVQKGCKVWVTSGSEDKIEKAKKLGAEGGVSYKEAGWEKTLLAALPKERPLFDAIIDGAGGDVIAKAAKVLKVSLSRSYG